MEFCSIGGNVVTNAGGLCCVMYGVTRDAVLGLEVVLADGRVLRTGGRTVKDVAGLDLTRLFVGSEGLLGVVTEVTVRLLPARPAPATLVATFDDVVRAGDAVARIVATGRPSMCEIMDAEVAVFGHAGDGNMHPTIVYPRGDDRRGSGPSSRSPRSSTRVCTSGETVSGEHGIGLAKRGHLLRQVGQVHVDVQRSIKDALDPLGILNPGKSLG